jgi:hypothetical protein
MPIGPAEYTRCLVPSANVAESSVASPKNTAKSRLRLVVG